MRSKLTGFAMAFLATGSVLAQQGETRLLPMRSSGKGRSRYG